MLAMAQKGHPERLGSGADIVEATFMWNIAGSSLIDWTKIHHFWPDSVTW